MQVFTIVLELLGGLGLFLFGMKTMSDAIERTAGAKLRPILEKFTSNKFLGLIVGTVFTALVQSSSACTSMVVSFVDSGLMNLYQAVGVIMGANIGTTITSQLVSFNLEQFAPIFLAVGVIMYMFIKKTKINRFGEIIVGFGVLFLGISIMGDAVNPLKESAAVQHMFASLSNPILALLIGWLVTAIIQSSSVTVSIIVVLASKGMFNQNLLICLYIILGCNMGACMTALLTSLSGKKDAKRAAMIHFLFNLTGSVIMFALLSIFGGWIQHLLYDVISNGNAGNYIANSHTIFKLVQVAIIFPFSSLLVKATYLVIPGEDKDKVGYGDTYKLQFIGENAIFNPATAVVAAQNEIERMGSLASDNINRAMNALITMDEGTIKEVWEVEKNIDFLSHAITNYLVKLTQSTMPIEDLKNIGGLFHVVNDIERIGDHATNIAEAAQKKKDKGISFSKEATKELTDMINAVNENIHLCLEMFVTKNEDHLKEIERIEDKVDQMERDIQDSHIDRMARGECTPEAGIVFNDIVVGLERVCDHATNIAFSVVKANNNG
ncbi:MAG: Na/Pi cotransporter family protein [Lachnospiraceae bacterium]|nr:Na/Pi cotransporter family protein [Lachnospiraceae bacterium]MBR3637647.1 Na/Pi cotransporter family protein [Lachnospiraceae bacterium]